MGFGLEGSRQMEILPGHPAQNIAEITGGTTK